MRRLLLISNSTQHGSGYLEHCADEVTRYFEGVRKVLFVPYALADHGAYEKAAREAFAKFGIELSSIHHESDPGAAVCDFDGMFIGGGNTFRLVKRLQDDGLLTVIHERIMAGKLRYMGTSAGSNVACPTIRTTNDMPIVEPSSFEAIGAVPFQLNPHYLDPDPNSQHMGETREQRIREFHEENPVSVLGLREGGMLHVEGDVMTLKGPRPLRLFRARQEPVEYESGADLSEFLR